MAADGAPMSFAAAMEKKTDSSPLRNVQLDGLAVLKILKHCKESMPSLVTGQLLGLDIGQTLEVTDCFPFPVSSSNKRHALIFNSLSPKVLQTRTEEDEGNEADGASYQLEMMRCLREINVDNNTVGWCAKLSLEAVHTILQIAHGLCLQ